MMRLPASPVVAADTLSDDLNQKFANDTPTVRAKISPSEEMMRDVSSGSAELVRVCKSCMEHGPSDAEFCSKCGEPLVTIRKVPDMYLERVVGGKYRIAQKIGQGGMGVVYLGLNDDLGQKVAVKFLSRKFADDEGIVLRFLNEAKSYCRVSHPNAVTLLEYGQHDDGALYIITEFIDGKNVTDTLKDSGPLGADTVLDIGLQVAEVLSVAHRTGVIHRDLKPDNIMLIPSPRGRFAVKVLDFGIAKIVDDDHGPTTETGSVFGTPEFMSPEQARGDVADGRSDIYALGIILFYMLTGKLPFQGKNKLVVLNQQLNEDPPRPSTLVEGLNIPAKLESVVMKCLNKRRGARYQTADDLLEALEELRIPGGHKTGRVGPKADANEAKPVLRSNTLRLGEDGHENTDAHADTLAASIHEGVRPLELESIDLSREQASLTGRVSKKSESGPAFIGVAVVAALAVAGLGAFAIFGGSDPVPAPVEQVELSQVAALLSIASTTLEEGSLDSAAQSLSQLEQWRDADLPESLQGKRSRLQAELEELRGLRSKIERAVAGNRCEDATELLGAVRAKSRGLAERLETETARCDAATGGAPPLPPADPAPAVIPAPVSAPAVVNPAVEPERVEPPVEVPPVVVDGPDVQPDPPGGLESSEQQEVDEEEGEDQSKTPDESSSGVEEGGAEEVPDGMALPPRQIE